MKKPNNQMKQKRKIAYQVSKTRRERESRKKYREGKKDGYTNRRLGFLLKAMASNGWTQAMLAEKTGMSRQHVHHIIVVADNTKLSKVETLFQAMGLNVFFELISDRRFIYEANGYEAVSKVGVKYIRRRWDETLGAFLLRALRESGVSVNMLSALAGVNFHAILHRVDRENDITVKHLLLFAEGAGLRVHWTIDSD